MDPGDVVMHKAYFEPLDVRRNTTFGPDTVPGDVGGGVTLTLGDSETPINGGQWYGQLTISGTTGKYEFYAWNKQVIDTQGLVAAGLVEIPMGTTTQKTSLTSIGSDGRAGYGREFITWSTVPAVEGDWDGFFTTYSPVMPDSNREASAKRPGATCTTTQLVGGKSELYSVDSSLDPASGFLKMLGSWGAGKGDTFTSPKIYVTRYVSALGTVTDPTDLTNLFWVNIPASWELFNCMLAEPEELDYMTTMRRSLQPPEGRVA